jgi:hypothetical protein
MKFVRFVGLVMLLSVALIGTAAHTHAAPATQAGCPGNMLQNPGFEGASRKTEHEGTSLSSAVGNGWSPWLIRGDARNNREPEFKVEQTALGGDRMRVHSGANAQKFFTTWGTHTAGMLQRVAVKPGATYTFSIYGMSYSGEADGWDAALGTFLSDKVQPGNYKMWVGIDPTGAVPSVGAPPPSTVIWTEPVFTTDTWVNLSIAAKATGPHMTVYTKGQPEWAVKHNDSFWDDGCFVPGGTPGAGAAAMQKTTTSASMPSTTATTAMTGTLAAISAVPLTNPISGTSYTVVKGDTLSAIAARWGTTVAALAKANNVANPSLIEVGLKLTKP